jgi:hypothetical protein
MWPRIGAVPKNGFCDAARAWNGLSAEIVQLDYAGLLIHRPGSPTIAIAI